MYVATTNPTSNHVVVSISLHGSFTTLLDVNGMMNIADHVNIHLFTVTTLYFFISGLKSARYSANENCAPTHIRSPHISPDLPPVFALDRISTKAPAQPIITPPAFIHVIGSFKIRNESIIAKIGIDVVTMLELMGDV